MIVQFVRRCCEAFLEHRTQEDGVLAKSQEDLAVKLYYKILEAIVADEKRRLTAVQLEAVLSQEVFHHALLAACFEVVLFSSHEGRYKFPWILDTLSVPPFHFLKVIEPMVRIEPDFTREVVTHFSRLEEQVLESLAWDGVSPLWSMLSPPSGSPESVPSCEEAFLPSQLEAVYDHVSPAGRLQTRQKTETASTGGT
jgi:hypothetical protein